MEKHTLCISIPVVSVILLYCIVWLILLGLGIVSQIEQICYFICLVSISMQCDHLLTLVLSRVHLISCCFQMFTVDQLWYLYMYNKKANAHIVWVVLINEDNHVYWCQPEWPTRALGWFLSFICSLSTTPLVDGFTVVFSPVHPIPKIPSHTYILFDTTS